MADRTSPHRHPSVITLSSDDEEVSQTGTEARDSSPPQRKSRRSRAHVSTYNVLKLSDRARRISRKAPEKQAESSTRKFEPVEGTPKRSLDTSMLHFPADKLKGYMSLSDSSDEGSVEEPTSISYGAQEKSKNYDHKGKPQDLIATIDDNDKGYVTLSDSSGDDEGGREDPVWATERRKYLDHLVNKSIASANTDLPAPQNGD